MSDDQNKTQGIHIETHASSSENLVDDLCREAPDKEKCHEFVDRLSEAANNIDRKND